MSRRARQALLWAFWAVHGLTVVWFWASNSGTQLVEGIISPTLALGRLAGLMATFAALTQFVLMGRTGWLEPVFGMDRLARFHRLNGYAAISLMLAHAVLIVVAYANLAQIDLLTQFLNFLSIPAIFMAIIALVLFAVIVGFSIYIVRHHLKFETWYYVHLLTYAAIALVPLHQLTQGGDLLSDQLFQWYWLALYAFVALNVVVWRFGRQCLLFARHRFEVERVTPETSRATSVYISGRHMQKFKAKPGQFVLIRFLTKGLWWQEHPFSLSRLPDGKNFRLTIRQLGDFTNAIPSLRRGTKVVVSGPHGAFTPELATRPKRLYIAGGVGITPIRSLIAAELDYPADSILLYGNKNRGEIIFKDELDKFGQELSIPIYYILSGETGDMGGFIDKAKIARLVPDITERDVFLCGPPLMMKGVRAALQDLGVPSQQVHFERFALHK